MIAYAVIIYYMSQWRLLSITSLNLLDLGNFAVKKTCGTHHAAV